MNRSILLDPFLWLKAESVTIVDRAKYGELSLVPELVLRGG